MSHKIDNVVFLRFFRSADNTDWLIEYNKYEIISVLRLNELSVNLYRISSNHLIANLSTLTIDVNVSLFDKAVSVAPRADATFSDVFI